MAYALHTSLLRTQTNIVKRDDNFNDILPISILSTLFWEKLLIAKAKTYLTVEMSFYLKYNQDFVQVLVVHQNSLK